MERKISMKNSFHFGKALFTALAAWLGSTMGLLLPTLILLFILMVTEYISGMLVARKETSEHPNSSQTQKTHQKNISSIYKKAGYVLTIAAALSMDFLTQKYAAQLGLQLDNARLFSLLAAIWFILNELLSILRNANHLGAALPKFLVRSIKEIKNDINQ